MKRTFMVLLTIAIVGLFTTTPFALDNGHYQYVDTACMPGINVQSIPPIFEMISRCDPTDSPNMWQVKVASAEFGGCNPPTNFDKYSYWTCVVDKGKVRVNVKDILQDAVPGVQIKAGATTIGTTNASGFIEYIFNCTFGGANCGPPAGAVGYPGTIGFEGNLTGILVDMVPENNSGFVVPAEVSPTPTGVLVPTLIMIAENASTRHFPEDPEGENPNGTNTCMPHMNVQTTYPDGEACNSIVWQKLKTAYPASGCSGGVLFSWAKYDYWNCEDD